MKLLRIHVDNFGKLSDLDMDFSDGINVIKEPNAWGKSTIAAFIKVMLYGFDNKKAPGAVAKERAFYQPWQGGTYGGELDFSVGNRAYRISRTFGATEKTDVFHIYDLQTNLESVDFDHNVGEQLFDLDSNSFRRSVFIAQNDCESKTSDAINAKLGNLAANTNDINNYDTAQEYLKSLANSLTPNRATGSIKRRKGQILELEEETKGRAAAETSLKEFSDKKKISENKKQELFAEREELARQLKLASEDSRRQQQQKQYLSLCEDVVTKLENLNDYADTFPIGVPEEEEFAANLELARQLEENQVKLSHVSFDETETENYQKLDGMFANGIPTELQIDEVIIKYNTVVGLKEEKTRFETSLAEREKQSLVMEPLPTKPKKASNLFVFAIALEVFALILFITAIVMFLVLKLSPFFMFVGVSLMVVATILFIVENGRIKKRKEQYEKDMENYRNRQRAEMDEISALKNKTEGKAGEILDVIDQANRFLKKYQVYCGPDSISSALYELKNQAREYIRLNDRAKTRDELEFQCRDLKNRINSFGRAWDFHLEKDTSMTLIALQTEAARLRSAQKEALLAKMKKEAFEQENDLDDLSITVQAEGDLEEINARIHELDEQLEQIRLTIEQYIRQMEDLKETLDLLDEKEQELEELRELQKTEQHRFDIVSMTQTYLQSAREHFTARYMAPISNAFRKYYKQIITSQGDDWVIDANVALKRREQGELREVGQLSAGYQDLIGVCMRLALVDAMYQEEKPFLVLDDPFVNLDEEKTIKGMGLINYVAEEYQTIYFTCHNSRTPE